MEVSGGSFFRVGREAEYEHDKGTAMEPSNNGFMSLHGNAEGKVL
jgi:hypothetical protein